MDLLVKEYPHRKPLLNYAAPYELLIAVILSAQTTDAGVNRVTPELFRRFPHPPDLAAASPADVEEIIRPTGFFRMKAVHIMKTAAALADLPGGKTRDVPLPDTMAGLTALPGVGRKTANVILYHIFHEPAIIVDTHFKRVSRRLGFTRFSEPEKIERQLSAAVPKEIQSDFSMTLNLHGRRYCRARRPSCPDCPLRELCPSADRV